MMGRKGEDCAEYYDQEELDAQLCLQCGAWINKGKDRRRGDKLEVQLCMQCGSLNWIVSSNSYVGEYRVRADGHVEFNERFDELEFTCNECGAMAALLGIKGTPREFKRLVELGPAERILQALDWAASGVIEITDDVSPEDLLDMVECFKDRWEMLHKDEDCAAVNEFFSRAKEIIGKLKLLQME